MFGSWVLAALLFLHHTLALPASVSDPLQITANDADSGSFPSIIRPSNLSILNMPTPRTGFRTLLYFNKEVSLKAFEMFENCIQMMGVLSKITWNGSIPRSIAVTDDGFASEISLYPMPKGVTLEADIAITGLYEIGVAIAEGNNFYQLEAGLLIGDVGRGVFKIQKRPPALGTNATFYAENVTVSDVKTPSTVDRGYFVDPADERFKITFIFDGVKLKSKDIFTSFLNAFAISSEHANHGLNAFIPAAPSAFYDNMSGDVVLSTWTVGKPDNAKMSWSRLKRALLVIWTRVVLDGGLNIAQHRPRFEGFSFGLEYDGIEIGAGRLLKLTSVSNTTDVATVAR